MNEHDNNKDAQKMDAWMLDILNRVKSGEVSAEDACQELRVLPYEDLGFAKVDHHRNIRTGFPEVVFGMGKTTEQVVGITERLVTRSNVVLVTHTGQETYDAVKKKLPDAVFHEAARSIVVDHRQNVTLKPGVAVITGGTADIPIAEEAALTAELMGSEVEKIFDVGVAGLHRLLDKLPALRRANVLVVVAGMEGALPSVVGGIVSSPIIAVPTSTGYGASFNGLSALLTMLNSCAPGIAAVNIDNGFGAGYMAGLINRGKDDGRDGVQG